MNKNQIRKIVYRRDGGVCRRCGKPLYLNDKRGTKQRKDKSRAHFHHIKYRSEGGLTTVENLLLTCLECEIAFHKKDGKDEAEYD